MQSRSSVWFGIPLIFGGALLLSCGPGVPDSDATGDAAGGADGGDTAVAGGRWSGEELVGSARDEDLTRIVSDGAGNLYATGMTEGDVAGKSFRGGSSDGYVVKYDRSGSREWVRMIGGGGDDRAIDITVDRAGHVYVAGWTDDGFDGRTYNGGDSDGFVVKFDTAGVHKWTRLVGTSDGDALNDVEVDGSGAPYVAGWTGTEFAGEAFRGGGSDALLVKLAVDGARQWVEVFGTSEGEAIYSMAPDRAGHLYVVGPTSGGLGGFSYGGGEEDGFVVSFDTSGARGWTRLFGGSGHEITNGVATDAAGDVYIGGEVDEQLAGEPYNGGNWDGFVLKYDSSGTRRWLDVFGTGGQDEVLEISSDRSGSVYPVGTIDQSFDGEDYHGGRFDGMVRRYSTSGVVKSTKLFGTSSEDIGRGVTRTPGGNLYAVGDTDGDLGGTTNQGGMDGFVYGWSP